jgi:glycosyltransferase involved in cell wall biosynthesis
MRVALVGPCPRNLEQFRGGVETSMANLIGGLKTFDDMELHVVAFDDTLKQPVYLKRDRVTYHYLPSPARFVTITLHRQHRRIAERALSEIKPDVVHAQDSLSHGYVCLHTAKAYPLVMSIHGIVQEECKHLVGTKERLRATLTSRLIERYCVKTARYLVQPTRYPERYFGSLISGKIVDTGNPIAEMFFSTNGEAEPGRLFYSGLVIRRKRLLDLLQALDKVRNRFPNVTLRVAGGTPDAEYLQLVKEWIITHGLERNVALLGPLSQAELVEEYKKCALLVLPSGQETSPMVIGEVMAVGRPVVATRVGGVPYLVDDGQTGFVVEVGDVDTLADRILTILSDDVLRTDMGQRSKEKAERQFRSRAVATKVREVYREAIEAASAS